VAIFGAGAVGLSAVMGAVACGASTIIALNRVSARRKLALELGATHTINPDETDAVEAIRDITHGRGVQFSLGTTGNTELFTQAVHSLAAALGVCGFVGSAPSDAQDGVRLFESMLKGRSIRGIMQGDSTPAVFIPDMIRLHLKGLLPYDKIVTTCKFSDINTAEADRAAGRAIKPVLKMPIRTH
jgi:aryl-alcohol dehydrogenase